MLYKQQWLAVLFALMIVVFAELIFVDGSHAQGNCNGARWEEINGYVYIEMESVENLSGAWERRTSNGDGRYTGFTGSSYLYYNTDSRGFSPDGEGGLLEYTVKISRPGLYRFAWRNVAGAEDSRENNDSWVKVIGVPVEDFYAIDQSDPTAKEVYPHGSGLGPNPDGGTNSGGFFKAYVNRTEAWTFQTRTFDQDPYPIFVEFDNPGTYTIQVSGRSGKHAIDRMVLYNVNIDRNSSTSIDSQTSAERAIAEDTTKTETLCDDNANIAPAIFDTDPDPNTTEVPLDQSLALSFTEPILPTSTGTLSFVCQPGDVVIPFTIDFLGDNTFAINPTGDLPPNSSCTFSVDTALLTDFNGANLQDNDGNVNGKYEVTIFTLSTPPQLTETVPDIGDTNVKVTAGIELSFSKLPTVYTGIPTLNCGSGELGYGIGVSLDKQNTFVLTPNEPLPFNSDCTLAITTNTMQDSVGNELVDNDGDGENGVYNLTFTTETRPQINSTVPSFETQATIAVDDNLTIVASEILVPTDQAGTISFTCETDTVETIDYLLDFSNAPTYIIDPLESLPQGAACAYSIPIDALSDIDGNTIIDTDLTDDNIFTLSFIVEGAQIADNGGGEAAALSTDADEPAADAPVVESTQ